MKIKITLIFLFFAFKLHAVEWPSDMYRIHQLNANFVAPINNYFIQLKNKFGFQYLADGYRVYNDNDQVIIQCHFRLINNTLKVIYYNQDSRFEFQAHPVKREQINQIIELNFTELIQLDNFRIDFVSLDYSLFKVTTDQTSTMNFKPAWGQVFIREIEGAQRLESRLWFHCQTCSGEPLLYIGQKSSFGQSNFFYQGDLVREISPRRFFEIANNGYLPSLTRQHRSILSQMQNSFNWPSISR